MSDESSAAKAPLPFSQRPIDKAPGHWVLARAGKRVLRPGGASLTRSMLSRAGLAGADVVEFAPGLGVTAGWILEGGPASYTGVEQDSDAAARVSRIVRGRGRCVNADARRTGLDGGCADVVVGEAMLSMQSDRVKAEIIAEAARLLRPGGRYAVHELALAPDDIDEEVATDLRKALARAINVNARPSTVKAWKEHLEAAGLVVEHVGTAPMALLSPGRVIADEGVGGAARIAWNLARDKDLRARVLTMRRTFKKYEKNMRGVAIVARKPKEDE